MVQLKRITAAKNCWKAQFYYHVVGNSIRFSLAPHWKENVGFPVALLLAARAGTWMAFPSQLHWPKWKRHISVLLGKTVKHCFDRVYSYLLLYIYNSLKFCECTPKPMVRMILLINPHVEGCQLYVFFGGCSWASKEAQRMFPGWAGTQSLDGNKPISNGAWKNSNRG